MAQLKILMSNMKQKNLTNSAGAASVSEMLEDFASYRPEVRQYMEEVIACLCERGKMTDSDRQSMKTLAMWLNVRNEAEENVLKNGVTITTAKGWVRKNPALEAMSNAQTHITNVLNAYGLTAMSRKRLERGEEPAEESELASFLSGLN